MSHGLRDLTVEHVGGALFPLLGERYWQEINAQIQMQSDADQDSGQHEGKVAVIEALLVFLEAPVKPSHLSRDGPLSGVSSPKFPPHRLVPERMGVPFPEHRNSSLFPHPSPPLPPPPPQEPSLA